MSKATDELELFLQSKEMESLGAVGKGQWTILYTERGPADGGISWFCAVTPVSLVSTCLEEDSWDFHIGNGMPGFSGTHRNGTWTTSYHRFGSDDPHEPLVFVRSFHGIRPDYIELCEEFRHFHNLYHDVTAGVYIRIDDGGDEEVVAKVSNGEVLVKTRRLREFLGAKQMAALLFFESTRFSDLDPLEIPEERRNVVHRDQELRYGFFAAEGHFGPRSVSRLLGKKVLFPLPMEGSGKWPFEDVTEHTKFIIAVDDGGKEVEFSCDPDGLANYFGKNAGAPHFLTPVVFRPEVLKKYFEHPERYRVEDGLIRCGGLWLLKIDNHHDDRVTVFLGDLGQTLSTNEQRYWRSYNVPPFEDGKDLSETNVRRSFFAEFADSSKPDLVFKARLESFQKAWKENYGWELFRQQIESDEHVLVSLRIPLSNSKAEFEGQVLSLTKLLVDALNDGELAQALGGAHEGEKSIAKLERYLQLKGVPSVAQDIALLRLLQDVRSKAAAHRKGKAYAKVAEELGLNDKPVQEVFRALLMRATQMLDNLTAALLPTNEK